MKVAEFPHRSRVMLEVYRGPRSGSINQRMTGFIDEKIAVHRPPPNMGACLRRLTGPIVDEHFDTDLEDLVAQRYRLQTDIIFHSSQYSSKRPGLG